jgi:RHS repeat-associated protein
VHKLRNILRKAPQHAHDEITDDYHLIVYASGLAAATAARDAFLKKWSKRCPGAVESLDEPGDELLTFYAFPREQWKTIRTTNVIERINEEFRRRVKTQGSFPVAEVDENGAVTERFAHVAGDHRVALLTRSGRTYAIIGDRIGTPRVVVDVAAGSIAQSVSDDEFGVPVSDSSPGFQPVGFAGGLYDPDTGLVRFGLRDYDPFVGRWTAPDPIRFEGGQANLFAYVDGDPVNRVDRLGLDWLHYELLAGLIQLYGDVYFATDYASAVFYSGAGNERAARRYARCKGKQTIFDTLGGALLNEIVGEWINNDNLTVSEGLDVWRLASAAFADGATGSATAFVDAAGGHDIEFSFWLQIEFPILQQNHIPIDFFPSADDCNCPQ